MSDNNYSTRAEFWKSMCWAGLSVILFGISVFVVFSVSFTSLKIEYRVFYIAIFLYILFKAFADRDPVAFLAWICVIGNLLFLHYILTNTAELVSTTVQL